jgi:hypothetical protein
VGEKVIPVLAAYGVDRVAELGEDEVALGFVTFFCVDVGQ